MSKYKKKYAKQLKNGLRRDGSSIDEICLGWDITRTTYYNWVQTHPEFKAADEAGNRDCAAWWHWLTRQVAVGEIKGNAGTICFAMKNIQGINWLDKAEVKTTHEEKINTININVLPSREKETLVIEHDDIN